MDFWTSNSTGWESISQYTTYTYYTYPINICNGRAGNMKFCNYATYHLLPEPNLFHCRTLVSKDLQIHFSETTHNDYHISRPPSPTLPNPSLLIHPPVPTPPSTTPIYHPIPSLPLPPSTIHHTCWWLQWSSPWFVTWNHPTDSTVPTWFAAPHGHLTSESSGRFGLGSFGRWIDKSSDGPKGWG